jgi:hypothetical protein
MKMSGLHTHTSKHPLLRNNKKRASNQLPVKKKSYRSRTLDGRDKHMMSPSWKKIQYTLLLLSIMLLFSAILLYLSWYSQGNTDRKLFSTVLLDAPKLSILIALVGGYVFACYWAETSNRWRSILYALLFLIVVPVITLPILPIYNSTAGRVCLDDSHCSWTCNGGSHNLLYIQVYDGSPERCLSSYPICEQFRCVAVNPQKQCGKSNSTEVQSECYAQLAVRLQDKSICNRIPLESKKSQCLSQNISKE